MLSLYSLLLYRTSQVTMETPLHLWTIFGQLLPRGTSARYKILSGSGSSAMGVMVLLISRNAYS